MAVEQTPIDNQDERIIHLLNRISFGPSPGDIRYVQKVGMQKFIDEQLNPQLYRDPIDSSNSNEFANLNGDSITLMHQFREFSKEIKQLKNEHRDQEAREESIAYFARTTDAYRKARLIRAINSPRQLEEVMTEFWYNHFNVFSNKVLDLPLVGPYEEQAIRPFALGKFKQLVQATCHHPAMLFYLDNWQNTAEGTPGAGGKNKGLNENYARELMELHTLGVDGGYKQEDVIQLAKILTGLGLTEPRPKLQLQIIDRYGATFDIARHDMSDKRFLGHVIKGSGEDEIEQAIDILCKHPATARHISYQLAQYFVADKPPAQLVARLTAVFTGTGGDIKEMMRTLLGSPEFWDAQYDQNKFKTPFRYVVSCYRVSGLEPQNYGFVSQTLKGQGQMIYGCLTPDGYKTIESAWLSPDALLRRIAFATQVGTGHLGGQQYDPPDYKSILATAGGVVAFRETAPKLAGEPEGLKSALLLGSPEFMRY